MLLRQLREFMRLNREAGLTEIANYLNVAPSVAESLVSHWVRKGCMVEQNAALCSQSCHSCHCKVYSWIEESRDSH